MEGENFAVDGLKQGKSWLHRWGFTDSIELCRECLQSIQEGHALLEEKVFNQDRFDEIVQRALEKEDDRT